MKRNLADCVTDVTDLRLHLEAVCPERNIARFYLLSSQRDLFGWVTVDRQWGRIGGKGQTARNSFATKSDASRYVRAILRRRDSLHGRIGVSYGLVGSGSSGAARTDRAPPVI
ncbi:WGR domain-containing protein [Sphingomonadaceae bacterium]|nr:WGR domain-containing protein [Sphingomonadaceae bacterium]